MGRHNGVECMYNPFISDMQPGELATASFWTMMNPMVLVILQIYRLVQTGGPKDGVDHPAYNDGWWDFADKVMDILEDQDYLIDLLEELDERV